MRVLALLFLLAPGLICAQDMTVDALVTVDTPREAYTIRQIQILQVRIERLEARVEKLERARTHKRKHK